MSALRYRWPGFDQPEDDSFGRHLLRRFLFEPPPVLLDLDAIRAMRQIRHALTNHGDAWVPIGPGPSIRSVPSGQMRVSGRIRDLAVSPDGQRVYALGGMGGIWGSDDAGVEWTPLGGWMTDPADNSPDIDFALAPGGCLLVNFGADAGSDEILVGTGETQPRSKYGRPEPGASLGGVGVLRAVGPLPAVRSNPFARPWKREANNLEEAGIFRLVHDPAQGLGGTIIAATSKGVFTRSGNFAENAAWTEVTVSALLAGDDWFASDAVWAPADGGFNSRLIIAVGSDDDHGLYISSTGAGGSFSHVELPGHADDQRLAMTATSDPRVFYVLGADDRNDGHNLWRVATTGSGADVDRITTGVPPEITDGQGFYSMAIAYGDLDDGTGTVQPTLFLGGATMSQAAALYKCVVSGTSGTGFELDFDTANNSDDPDDDPTWIGRGVHADVHQVRVIGDHVWVACDGGVFVSAHRGAPASFVDRNDGLVMLEAGYVDAHPHHDAPVIIGTQDNGVIKRAGNMVWERTLGGDGGGVAYHPSASGEVYGQAHSATWRSSDYRATPSGRVDDQPVFRSSSKTASEKGESGRALFYSNCDVVLTGGQANLALGTDRVWVGNDWNEGSVASWENVPSGRDSRSGSVNAARDRLSGKVVSCRWADGNNLVVLTRAQVLQFTRPTSGRRWTQRALSDDPDDGTKAKAERNTNITTPHMGFLPALGYWSEIAVDREVSPSQNRWSLYVSGTGQSDRADMDTLWWFDGEGRWYPTGLKSHPQGTPAPAYAVVCDPETPTTVYVGTRVGVWKGERSVDGAGISSWDWEPFTNGLPESLVQDLAVLHSGSTKLLRAALPARGVWEIDLNQPLQPRTYLRVHARDTRRSLPTSLNKAERKDRAAPNNYMPGNEYVWWSSPDIRVRPRPGTAYPNPYASGVAAVGDPEWVWQSALHSLEPSFAVSTGFKDNVEAALARFRAVHNSGASGDFGESDWDALVAAGAVFCADPWVGIEPSEADLFQLLVDSFASSINLESQRPGPKRVHVQLHHRDHHRLEASDAVVTLLSRTVTFDSAKSVPDQQAGWANIAISAQFKTRVRAILESGASTAPAGWSFAQASRHRASPTNRLDSRQSRSVDFDIDLGADPIMLLAVVHSTADPIDAADALDGGTVKDLVLGSSHVACRIIDSHPHHYP